jgi:hypothetical protein
MFAFLFCAGLLLFTVSVIFFNVAVVFGLFRTYVIPCFRRLATGGD